jgi:type IV pilus assembly protein PilQ
VCSQRLRCTIFMTLLALSLSACAGRQPEKDPPFENWRVMAEKSKGHSPTVSSRSIQIPERRRETELFEEEDPASKAPKPLPTEKISIRMHKSEVAAVLRALARGANQNLMIGSNVKGEVSINVEDTPWDQVFQGVLRTTGLAYVWEGDIIRVMTLDDMEHDLKLDAVQEKQKANKIGIKRVEPLMTKVIEINYSDPNKLKQNLSEFLTKDKDGKPRGSIMVDEHTNALIIQAIREDIAKLIPLIQKLDRPRPQILINANIVEATRDTARDLGIQWGGMYSAVAGGGNKVYMTPGGSDGTAVPPGSADNGSYAPTYGQPGISGQGFALNFPVTEEAKIAANGAASLGLMFGKIGANILEMQLSALQSEGRLNILSSPSITTLDNQAAFTENGERVPYVSTDKEGNRQVRFEDAVLRLEITPHVIDGKNLKMQIVVKKDEVDTTRRVEGNPLIIKKQTTTMLMAYDGETIVISGLTKQRRADVENGLPGLKDVPVLGYLFKGESKADKMEEVLIFITPHILEKRVAGEQNESE